MVAVNLRGMFIAARLAFAQMRRQSPQGGRIVNNGSISAHVPRPGSVCYTATKHAITGLTRSLSLDGREFDIACGQIDIGNAETPMVAALKATQPDAQTMAVSDVARAVLYMAGLPPEANVQFMTRDGDKDALYRARLRVGGQVCGVSPPVPGLPQGLTFAR